MDATTLKALEESIARWGKMEEKGNRYAPRRHACALCKLFWRRVPWGLRTIVRCVGCPVRERTGRNVCARTPYTAADDAHGVWKYAGGVRWLFEDAWRKAATAERKFLESLLPKRAKPRKK